MRFTFVDRVLELTPGVKITTVKCLTLAEEYLADHFPRFPVMPGVLMLEAMTEAGAWLVRVTDNFSHTMVTLKEARNIRYAEFVRPGHVLTVTAEILGTRESEVRIKAQATLAGQVAVSGQLFLERANLVDTRPEMADTDTYLRQHFRNHFALLAPTRSGDSQQTWVAVNGEPGLAGSKKA
ncbi:MAG TPA: 3-hydroxyacyl-ACP dehydratase FabZ family protein [Pirellulales bacterium]|jgi:3-hydroxyacyl-[acyl-carrier-protein] dehydratase|nr:3-hydroxyacyl-ACP dehydratase FabZ family protein [Pirellulales bacterium]